MKEPEYAVDHAAIINPRHAAAVFGQKRFDHRPLEIHQIKIGQSLVSFPEAIETINRAHLDPILWVYGLVKFGHVTAAEDKRRYAYILTPKGIARKTALKRSFSAAQNGIIRSA